MPGGSQSQPVGHSLGDRARCYPRLQDDPADTARAGRHISPLARSCWSPHGRARSRRLGSGLDILADGGYCTRPALGPHRRGVWRGSVSLRNPGCRRRGGIPRSRPRSLRQRPSSRSCGPLPPRLDRRLRKTLCGLRRSGIRSRLQHHGNLRTHTAECVFTALPRLHRGRLCHCDECLQRPQRRAHLRQRMDDSTDSQNRVVV